MPSGLSGKIQTQNDYVMKTKVLCGLCHQSEFRSTHTWPVLPQAHLPGSQLYEWITLFNHNEFN
jgi:hypothetical protein